jgi:pSer/pThr/pTyr-binding forkhead associated (FHA) protein
MNPTNQFEKEIQEAIITQTAVMWEPPTTLKGRLDLLRQALQSNNVPTDEPGFLVLPEGSFEGTFHALHSETKVGISEECDIPIEGNYISRHHCTICGAGYNWMVIDEDSTNGTFINGNKITQYHLRDGDILQVGKVMLLFFANTPAPVPDEPDNATKLF